MGIHRRNGGFEWIDVGIWEAWHGAGCILNGFDFQQFDGALFGFEWIRWVYSCGSSAIFKCNVYFWGISRGSSMIFH
jgi:hypothetical protein